MRTPAPVLVRAPLPATPPLNVSVVPAVSTWIVPPPALTVNPRSLATLAAVYSSVPPLKTTFPEALLDWPSELATPPLAMPSTDSVPAEIVVAPE